MTDIKAGQRVKVHADFEGVVSLVNHDESVDVLTDGADREIEYIPARFVTAIVENWPPQVGDVWSVNDVEYFVRRSTFSGVALLMPDDPKLYVLESAPFKALNPVLKRRK